LACEGADVVLPSMTALAEVLQALKEERIQLK
jgi:hypothetical protein